MIASYTGILLGPRNLALLAAALVCGLLVIAILKPAFIPGRVNDSISGILHKYLCWKYPITDLSGHSPIPTCPYKWPNGQGDVGKFLEGIENSVSWEKSHGQIYRIWSGMKPEIVLTQSEHLQTVFSDSDKHAKAVNNNSGYIMNQLLGQCVGLISGEDWRTVREVVEVPFVHRKSSNYLPMIKDQISRHFKDLWQQKSLPQGLLHPAEDLKMLPFWVIAEVLYGKLPPNLIAELKSLAPIRENLFKHVIRGGLSRFAWMRFFPTEAGAGLTEFKSRWAIFNKAAYSHACQQANDNTRAPEPAAIVSLYESVSGGHISEAQFLQTMDEALFANLDVTTGGIAWNPVFLAANLPTQQSLRQEINGLKNEEEYSAYIQSNTTLLAACITESSRLKPLAAFSVPQSAPTDRVVGNYLIPSGTNFIVDAYALNVRDEAFWGADAAKYRPERFLDPRTKMRPTQLRYHLWRFGFGPRQCMGRYVADLIIRELVAHLLREFDLGMVDGKDWERGKEVWITHPGFSIRCVKREEFESGN